jgi:hypothetical protein
MRPIIATNLSNGNRIVAFTQISKYGVWSKYYTAFVAVKYGEGINRYCDAIPTLLSFDAASSLIKSFEGDVWFRRDLSIKPIGAAKQVLITGTVSEIQEFATEDEEQYIKVFGSFVDTDEKSLREVLIKPDTKVFIL